MIAQQVLCMVTKSVGSEVFPFNKINGHEPQTHELGRSGEAARSVVESGQSRDVHSVPPW